MKVLVVLAVLAFAAANVLAQNPYEYIDDDLLQKVGQIVFQYDQKVAASRSGGGSSQHQVNNNYQQQQVRRFDNAVSGSYQRPEVKTAHVPNYVSNNANNNMNYRRENNYGYVQQQNFKRENNYGPVQQQNFRRENNYGPAQQQQVVRRQQRQFNYGQQQQQVVQPRVQPQPYVAAAPRVYQEPQQQKQQVKSGFTGYSLSQPLSLERIGEFHFTENRNQNQNQGNFDSVAVEGNKFRYA